MEDRSRTRPRGHPARGCALRGATAGRRACVSRARCAPDRGSGLRIGGGRGEHRTLSPARNGHAPQIRPVCGPCARLTTWCESRRVATSTSAVRRGSVRTVARHPVRLVGATPMELHRERSGRLRQCAKDTSRGHDDRLAREARPRRHPGRPRRGAARPPRAGAGPQRAIDEVGELRRTRRRGVPNDGARARAVALRHGPGPECARPVQERPRRSHRGAERPKQMLDLRAPRTPPPDQRQIEDLARQVRELDGARHATQLRDAESGVLMVATRDEADGDGRLAQQLGQEIGVLPIEIDEHDPALHVVDERIRGSGHWRSPRKTARSIPSCARPPTCDPCARASRSTVRPTCGLHAAPGVTLRRTSTEAASQAPPGRAPTILPTATRREVEPREARSPGW